MMMVYGCVRVNPLGLKQKGSPIYGVHMYFHLLFDPIESYMNPIKSNPREDSQVSHQCPIILACQCAQNINRIN